MYVCVCEDNLWLFLFYHKGKRKKTWSQSVTWQLVTLWYNLFYTILISYGLCTVLCNNPWKNEILLGIDRLRYMWYFRNNHDNEMSYAPHSIKVRWLMKIHWSKEELSSSKWHAQSICFMINSTDKNLARFFLFCPLSHSYITMYLASFSNDWPVCVFKGHFQLSLISIKNFKSVLLLPFVCFFSTFKSQHQIDSARRQYETFS